MTHTQVLESLRKLSTPRALKVSEYWASLSPDEYIGVGLTKLKAIAREIRPNHERALLLWRSNIHEGKLLATLTEEPKKVSRTQLERQVQEIHAVDLADYFANYTVAKTPFLQEKANKWTQLGQPEMVRRTGYACVCHLAKQSKILNDNYFKKHLTIIEFQIEYAPTWVKDGQNQALIAIGSRNRSLNTKAIDLARKIGKIELGRSSFKTPDAVAVLNSKKVQNGL